MKTRALLALGLLMSGFVLQGCALAVGAGAAVVADEIAEDNRGGDGLF